MNWLRSLALLSCSWAMGIQVGCEREEPNLDRKLGGDPGGQLLVKIVGVDHPGALTGTLEELDNYDKGIVQFDECRHPRSDNQISFSASNIGYTPPQHATIQIFDRGDDCEGEETLVFKVSNFELSPTRPEKYSILEAEIAFAAGAIKDSE